MMPVIDWEIFKYGEKNKKKLYGYLSSQKC